MNVSYSPNFFKKKKEKKIIIVYHHIYFTGDTYLYL